MEELGHSLNNGRSHEGPGFVPRDIGSHDYFVRCAAVSPDGSLLATGDEDCLVIIWSVLDEVKGLRLQGHRDAIYCIAFINDSLLLTGAWDRTVRLWDTRTGECLRVLRGHFDRVERVNGCLAARRIVSADESGEICEFDLEDGKLVNRWSIHENRVRALTIWSNRGWVTGGDDGKIFLRVWGAAPAQRIWMKSACYGVSKPALNGKCAALASDGAVYLVDIESGELENIFSDEAYLRSIDLYPGSNSFVCGGKSGRVYIWSHDIPENRINLRVQHSILEVRWLSPNTIIGCGRNGLVFSLVQATDETWEVHDYLTHSDHVFALAVDAKNRRFFTAGFDGRVICWSPVTANSH